MNDETTRWRREEALFDALADLPPDARAARLADVARHDAPLAARVAELLAADDRAGGFIDRTVADAVIAAAAPGRTVGPWRLLRELGQGGMGSVWLAERADGAYDAQVAIKFLLGTMALPGMARRFRTERQFLADLAHPDIARLLDGGSTPDGTPYLVMEFVDGVPIDRWCRDAGADVRARVALLERVCRAVQHAHTGLVVHRDLKPSNVLVRRDGTPTLLDFGIATMLDSSRDDAREPTLYQALTPSYASPEHLRGERVTTASDTWSLGVMLYRLLAGVAPFDLTGCSPAEIERRITGGPPPPPSTRASVADGRLIRGDLDAIAGKALHPHPSLRYETAADLAADLRRWLDAEPVQARAPTAVYRARTFVRRHPIGVAATALAIVLLALTTATSLVQAARAERERDLADARRRTAEGATAFLVALFNLVDPNTNAGETVSARILLDVGAESIRDGTHHDPGVRMALTPTLASIYRNLADYEAAGHLLDTALALRARASGVGSLEHVRILHEMAVLQFTQARFDSARVLHGRVAAALARLPDADRGLQVQHHLGYGLTLAESGRPDEAVPLLRAALEIARTDSVTDDVTIAQGLVSLASVLRDQANYDDAIPLLEEAVARETDALGRVHLETANALNHLGRTLTLAGRPADAEPLVREAIAIQDSLHGEPHPETAASLGSLASLLAALGRHEESDAARRRSIAMMRTVFSDAHPYVAMSVASLGDAQIARGAVAAADSSYTEALRIWRVLGSDDAPQRASALEGIARVRLALGRPHEAIGPLREALALRGDPSASWRAAITATALAEALHATDAASEARALAATALATLEGRFGADDLRTIAARMAVAGGAR